MPLLYYWHPDNHRRDLDFGVGYHLNQGNPLLHEVGFGESLWAFTRNGDGLYVLAAELVIKAKTRNPPGFRYGPYRVWGHLATSRYFRVEDAPSAEQIVRALSIRANAERLGQAFQGHAAVRRLTEEDHRMLTAAARDLPLEPRARLLPEERLEAAVLLGDGERVQELLHDEPAGIAEERRAYLYSTAPTRNRNLADELQRLYEGRCQLCRWDPREEYAHNLCHAHHVQWLSRGGEDDVKNMMLVCPNHHAAIHRCDAPFDFGTGTYRFAFHEVRLTLNRHLPVWN